jgi:hypothetical protein
MKISQEDSHMINGKKNGCQTTDIQGSVVRQPGEQNFP